MLCHPFVLPSSQSPCIDSGGLPAMAKDEGCPVHAVTSAVEPHFDERPIVFGMSTRLFA